MRWFRYTLIIIPTLVCLTLAFQLGYLYFHRECTPKDFSYNYPLGSNEPVEVTDHSRSDVQEILSQKFYFLGRGTQMTAFVSQDGAYVIKFFNPRRFVREEWFYDLKKLKRMLSLKWFSQCYFKRKQRLRVLSERYRLAFNELKEESGIEYIHINASTKIEKNLELYDRDGNRYTVHLPLCPFILQKRVELSIGYLQSLMKEGKFLECKMSLESLVDLFISRALKGISDRNQSLEYNYGFFNGKAIQLDLGRIEKQKNGDPISLIELQRIFTQLEYSILEFIPELHTILNEIMKKKISSYQKIITEVK